MRSYSIIWKDNPKTEKLSPVDKSERNSKQESHFLFIIHMAGFLYPVMMWLGFCKLYFGIGGEILVC